MNILVTGLGFVGINVVLHLLNKNFNVTVLVRKSGNPIRKHFMNVASSKGADIVTLEKFDKESILKILEMKDIDAVVNCVGALRGDYDMLFVSNVKIPLDIADAVLEQKSDISMIHIGTAYMSCTMGKVIYEEENYLDEKLFKPKTAYEKTKYLCEKYLYERVEKGLRLVVLRPVMMLGKYCYHEESNSFIEILRKLNYIPITDKGFNILDIENFCIVIEHILNSVHNIHFDYLYVPGTYYTLTNIMEAFSQVLEIKCRYTRVPFLDKLLPLFAPRTVKPYLKYLGVKFTSRKLEKYVTVPKDDIFKIARDHITSLKQLNLIKL